ELIIVGEEANLRVVAGRAGGDEELPIGGLEQQKLAAELLHDAFAEGAVTPASGGAGLAGVEFGGIDVRVGPRSLGVHPDVVVALGSPGAFVHGDEARAREAVEIFRATDELDARIVVMQGAGHGLKPKDAFKP